MKVALAILNWNGLELLREFLPNVVSLSPEADVYLIDNNSSDDSLVYVQKEFPEVKIIRHAKNHGFCGGYNLAIPKIAADVIGILNNDLAVSPNWLPPLIQLLANHQELAAVQPQILDYNQPDKFEYAGAGGGFLDNLGYPYCNGRVFWTLESVKNHTDEFMNEVHWASGACMLIRKNDFMAVDGFDEDFFAHQEEIDLCWRLRNRGRKIAVSGNSKVYHFGNATLDRKNPRKTYLNFRNNLFLLVKNLPTYQLLYKIPIRLVLDGITALVFWRYEGFAHLTAVFKAHLAFYGQLIKMLRKRKMIRAQQARHRFVPFQYFVLKRKKFSELKP